MQVIENRDLEPSWEYVAFYRQDFRPHFDGDFVNFCTTINPAATIGDTEELVEDCASRIAAWIIEHLSMFGCEDKFQIVIGWPESVRDNSRQIIKDGGDLDSLRLIALRQKSLRYFPDWSRNVFEKQQS